MVKTAPVAAFKMAQAKLLLEFLVIALDAPTQFGDRHQFARGKEAARLDSQYLAGSFSSLGHSISSHCVGCGWLRQ